MVGLLVALDVEEGVSVPHLGLSGLTQGDRGGLTVPDEHVSRLINQIGRTSQSVQTLDAW